MRASRVVSAGAVIAIAVGSVSLSATAQAKAATVPHVECVSGTRLWSPRSPIGRTWAATAPPGSPRPRRNSPPALPVQLRKQLGITPEQFLAEGQAGADAGKVIASLRAERRHRLRREAGRHHPHRHHARRRRRGRRGSDGASAVIGTAHPVKTVKAKALSSPADGTSHLLGGDFWAYLTDVSAGEGVICSTGFNGYAKSTGAREFLTAGHCADYRDTGEPRQPTAWCTPPLIRHPVNLDDKCRPKGPAPRFPGPAVVPLRRRGGLRRCHGNRPKASACA